MNNSVKGSAGAPKGLQSAATFGVPGVLNPGSNLQISDRNLRSTVRPRLSPAHSTSTRFLVCILPPCYIFWDRLGLGGAPKFRLDGCGRPPVPVICFGFLLVPSVLFHESGRPRRQYQAPQGVDKHSAMQLDGVGKSRGACAHDLGGACPLFCDRVPVILGSVCPLFWKRVPVILGARARYFGGVCPLCLACARYFRTCVR